MNDELQDEHDMALAALLNSQDLDRPLRPSVRDEARRIASLHFGAPAGGGGGAALLPEGAVLGSYRIERVLGVGGQAVVYLARHTRLNKRLVALKVPHGEVSRMLREADAIARLAHAGVVGIVDLDPEAEPPFLVLEYCAGGSLADRLAEGPLPEEEVLRITRALLEALAYAHDRDVVHRDLKPENVLFDEGGNSRIADFGLGKVVAEQVSLSLSQGSRTGVAGTPLYMAPEQERPGAEVDGRADLFALGKLIYRMLTGEQPRTLRPVEHLRPGLRHPWSQLVFKLTESFPDARPASARAVLAELDGWAQPAPRVSKQAEAIATLAAKFVDDMPSHRERLDALVQQVLANPRTAVGTVLALIGGLGVVSGSEPALLIFLCGLACLYSGREEANGAAAEAKLVATPERARANQRSGAQVTALVFAVVGYVVAFFTTMGGTLALVMRGNSLDDAGVVTLVVAGFLLAGSTILYALSRPVRAPGAGAPELPHADAAKDASAPWGPPVRDGVFTDARGLAAPEPQQLPERRLPSDDPRPRA